MCTCVECYGNWVDTEVLDKVFGRSAILAKKWSRTRGVKSSLLPVFVNKHSFIGTITMSIHFHVVCGCFSTTTTGFGSCDRDIMTPRASNIY